VVAERLVVAAVAVNKVVTLPAVVGVPLIMSLVNDNPVGNVLAE